jgi:hypothetical protein
MNRKNRSESEGPQFKLAEFHKFVMSELPDGLPGEENAYKIRIGETPVSVVIFGPERDKVTLGIFTEGGKYARKTLEINSLGDVTEDTSGAIPDIDLQEDEPDFSEMTNAQIAETIIDQIKNYKRDNVN